MGITYDSYFVIDNIIKGKHLTMGQFGKLFISSNVHLKNYFVSVFGQTIYNSKQKSLINSIGNDLIEFAKIRNIVAHKDGISHEKLLEARANVLGIGEKESLIVRITYLYT